MPTVHFTINGKPVSCERDTMPRRRAEERLRDFEPVELSLSEQDAISEARRCLQCDLEESEE